MKKTTASLSELVHAASEVAFACSDNGYEAYQITQQALIELIRNLPADSDFFENSEVRPFSDRYFH
jgi:hypothetical protein